MDPEPREPIVAFLTGATAVGKSAVALILAERWGWEIVSVDSRQIYRQLEIGTAKPSATDRARVPHHLLDQLDPEEAASAGWFRGRFLAVRSDLRARGARGLAVGGTGLYWEACTLGLHPLPQADPRLRAELELRADQEGLAAVFAQLEALDPGGAARIDRHNRHRVIRALELVRRTGRSLEQIYAGEREGGDVRAPSIVLRRPRTDLHERIRRRCDAMLEAGLVAEIARLLASGLAPESPGLRTVGYREFLPHLLAGVPLEACGDRFLAQTRQYAKRQETWFRNRLRPEIELEIRLGEGPASVADRVERCLGEIALL